VESANNAHAVHPITSLITVKKEVEELKPKIAPKPKDTLTVYMWMPDGKDARA